MVKEDLFIQLQLKDAPDEVNQLLLDFDVVIRVDDDNKYSSFTIENFTRRETSVNYIQLEDRR
jgi:hypothetical protein